MPKFFLYTFLLISFLFAKATDGYGITPLNIRIFSENNGYGLEADQKILKDALERLGHSVEVLYYRNVSVHASKIDVNIFFEKINPKWFNKARYNWFIPNPEWYFQPQNFLKRLSLILCRTKEVERIFNSLHLKTYYLGFTSRDCLQIGIPKDFSIFFHLAGGAIQKGTNTIVDIWANDDQLPLLILLKQLHYSHIPELDNLSLITEHLPEEDLRVFQNKCGFHLCPSETEGFGHYIVEAMSAEAVVITTDAPPMNEFIKDKRCLVSYNSTAQKHLGTNYYVDPVELKNTIINLMHLPQSELEEIGRKNREHYLQKTEDFYNRLELLLQTAAK